MPYEVLEKEIRTLSETDLAKVSDFIMQLKLKESLDSLENKLDEADLEASSTETRLTHEEVFSAARSKIKVV